MKEEALSAFSGGSLQGKEGGRKEGGSEKGRRVRVIPHRRSKNMQITGSKKSGYFHSTFGMPCEIPSNFESLSTLSKTNEEHLKSCSPKTGVPHQFPAG